MSQILELENRTILQGQVLEQLKKIPDDSIDCVCTSPPYWGIRDYGIEGQWGLEPDFFDYLDKLLEFMKEVKRVIKPTGTIWINLGDTYYQKVIGSSKPSGLHGNDCDCGTCRARSTPLKGIKTVPRVPEKSRCLIPSRFATRCVDELKLILRNDIIWEKPNSIPDSVKSKFPNTWEPIFLFVKSQKFYFDLESVSVISKSKLFETKRQKDVFHVPVKRFHGSHTATFPESIPSIAIKAGSPPNGWILDPFFGSGTVGEVSEKLGRNWIGIELNPETVELSRKRVEPFQNGRLL